MSLHKLTGGAGAVAIAAMLAFMNAPSVDAAGKVAAASSTATAPQRGLADNALSPLSMEWQAKAEEQLARGELAAATDSFEAALVADPRNRRAYAGLARVAEAQGMPGKAVRFYREALELEPNDLDILELQGKALLMRGAKARAELNLERLKMLCTAPCPQRERLAMAIADAPRVATAARVGTDAKPSPTTAPGTTSPTAPLENAPPEKTE